MRIKTYFFQLALLCILLSETLWAQNARFSQIDNAPVMLNPALSGRFVGDYRAGILYSWQSSTTAAIAHQNLYVEGKLFNNHQKNASETSSFNVLREKSYFGLTLNHYEYGNDVLRFTENTSPIKARFTSVSGAYHFNLTSDARYYAGVGAQLTNADASLDETISGNYDTEISGGGFRYNKTPSAVFKYNKGYFTASAGFYIGFQTEEHLLEMGFAMYHLNQPYNDLTGDPDTKQRTRISAYTNAVFKASPTHLLLFKNAYWEEGIYNASSSYKDSAYVIAFYSGVEVVNTQPKTTFHANFALMTRNFQSLIPQVNLWAGKQVNLRLSYEVPINKTIHPANNAYRTELFCGVSLGNLSSQLSVRNRKNYMW